ncbi:MAG: accessory gene regulator ArgB-like protein [Acetobacterium sp.]
MLTLTKNISTVICNNLNINGEKREVIEYGMIALVQMVFFFSAVFFIGIFTGTALAALTICLTTSILRKYSGGVHVSSINICTIIGVTFCLFASVLIQYVLVDWISLLWLSLVAATCYALAFIIIYLKAPVDSENKPIKTSKKKKRLRKSCYIILMSYALITTVLLYLSYQFNFSTTYVLCILFGLMWQILTLTKMGSILIGGLDQGMSRIWQAIKSQ